MKNGSIFPGSETKSDCHRCFVTIISSPSGEVQDPAARRDVRLNLGQVSLLAGEAAPGAARETVAGRF